MENERKNNIAQMHIIRTNSSKKWKIVFVGTCIATIIVITAGTFCQIKRKQSSHLRGF